MVETAYEVSLNLTAEEFLLLGDGLIKAAVGNRSAAFMVRDRATRENVTSNARAVYLEYAAECEKEAEQFMALNVIINSGERITEEAAQLIAAKIGESL